MKKKYIPLIFLFLIFFIIILFPRVYSATTTEIFTANRILQPVEGQWFYQERNDLMDFEQYLEGSSPNLTTSGTVGETDVTGIFKLQSSLFDDLMPSTLPPISALANISYIQSNYTTSNYNVTGASWENVSIANTSISSNRTYHFNGMPNSTDTLGSVPNGWTVTQGDIKTVHQYVNQNNTIRIRDDTVAYGDCEYSFDNSLSSGKIQVWFAHTDVSEYGAWWAFYNGATRVFLLRFNGGASDQIQIYNGTYYNILTLNDATWYNLELDIDCALETCDVYINYVYRQGIIGFENSVADIDRCTVLIDTTPDESLYIDGLTMESNPNFIEGMNQRIEDNNATYISDIIDFGSDFRIDNIDISSLLITNSSLSFQVTDNSTGSFDSWMNYTSYLGNTTQFLKYKVLINCTGASESSIFYNATFQYVQSLNVSPFINGDDKMLLFYPIKATTKNPAEFFYNFNMSNQASFTRGEIEFIFIHYFFPNLTENGTGSIDFTVMLNEDIQFMYNLQHFYDVDSDVGMGNWSVYDGSQFDEIYNTTYRFHDNNNSITDFYFMVYDVVIDYTYNSRVSITVSEMTSFDEATELFENTSQVIANSSESSAEHANFYFGTNGTKGAAMIMAGIDSSRMRIDYQRNEMFDLVTKNFTAYNVEDYFSFHIPEPTIDMTSTSITSIELYSELEADEFISFIADVKGNLYPTETFYNLDSYTTVSTSVYNDGVYNIYINAKYRCKNLNEFNNTIYMKLTRFYVPYDPGFSDLLLLVIPPAIILLGPSSVAAYKFGKNGFLLVFFMMTLISMGMGIIPPFHGFLIISVLVLIFIQLLRKNREETPR